MTLLRIGSSTLINSTYKDHASSWFSLVNKELSYWAGRQRRGFEIALARDQEEEGGIPPGGEIGLTGGGAGGVGGM